MLPQITVRVVDGSGDTVTTVKTDDKEQMAAAQAQFEQLVNRGSTHMAVAVNTDNDSVLVNEFPGEEEDVQVIEYLPRQVGG